MKNLPLLAEIKVSFQAVRIIKRLIKQEQERRLRIYKGMERFILKQGL